MINCWDDHSMRFNGVQMNVYIEKVLIKTFTWLVFRLWDLLGISWNLTPWWGHFWEAGGGVVMCLLCVAHCAFKGSSFKYSHESLKRSQDLEHPGSQGNWDWRCEGHFTKTDSDGWCPPRAVSSVVQDWKTLCWISLSFIRFVSFTGSLLRGWQLRWELKRHKLEDQRPVLILNTNFLRQTQRLKKKFLHRVSPELVKSTGSLNKAGFWSKVAAGRGLWGLPVGK